MEHLSFSHLNFQSICVTDCLLQVLTMADPLLEVGKLMKVRLMKVRMERVVNVNVKMVMNMNMWMVMVIFWLSGDNDPYYIMMIAACYAALHVQCNMQKALCLLAMPTMT